MKFGTENHGTSVEYRYKDDISTISYIYYIQKSFYTLKNNECNRFYLTLTVYLGLVLPLFYLHVVVSACCCFCLSI